MSLSRILPDAYPLADDVDTYIAVEHGFGHMLDVGVIQPRIASLDEWSSGELALPGLRSLVDDDVPRYAWDESDAGIWQFDPSRLARLARRVIPVD